MIIKSMSVKNTDWSYHYDYLLKGINKMYSWGLNVDPNDKDAVIDEYKYNYSFLQNNLKSKNIYYHEIISLPSNNLSLEKQQDILYNLTDKYISQRANGNLVIGAIHQDTNNIHMHLKISSNKYMETRPTRLSKQQFKAVQRDLENYKNKHYPTLKTNHYQDKYKKQHKQKQNEQEMNRRKKLTKKQKVLNEFKQTLNNATTKKDLFLRLKNKGLKMYRKGKYFGIVDINNSNRRYRLKTLEENLDLKFIAKVKKMEQQQKIQQAVFEQQQQQQQNKQQGINYDRSI